MCQSQTVLTRSMGRWTAQILGTRAQRVSNKGTVTVKITESRRIHAVLARLPDGSALDAETM